MFIGCVPAHALYFSSYEIIKSMSLEYNKKAFRADYHLQQQQQQQQQLLHVNDADAKKETEAQQQHHHQKHQPHANTLSPTQAMLAGGVATLLHDCVMTPMDTMKQKLEGEVLLAMDLTKEKEFIIKELETRQAELSAQVEALKEKSLSSSSKLVALETNLKEASIAERERLLVLQNENKRLEKRLKDTWTALQGAHAVVEQTKTAAKDAVRNANAAAAKAEKVAIKAKRELEEIRRSAPATAIIRKVTEAEDVSQMQSSPQLSSRHRSATSPQSMSQRSSPAPKLSPVKPPSKVPSLDDEMQRASDLLERLSRASREPSLRDDGSVGKSETSSQIGAVGAAVFGYRGA